MKYKKSVFLRILIYSIIIICSFATGVQINKYLQKKNKNSIDNIARCLTLNDYIIKVKNANNMQSIDKKSALYIIKNFITYKKNILKKTCPDIYNDALKLCKKNFNN